MNAGRVVAEGVAYVEWRKRIERSGEKTGGCSNRVIRIRRSRAAVAKMKDAVAAAVRRRGLVSCMCTRRATLPSKQYDVGADPCASPKPKNKPSHATL